MDLKEIEKLMASMVRAKMKRIAIKKQGFEIELERETTEELSFAAHKQMSLPPVYHLPPSQYERTSAEPPPPPKKEEILETKGHYITSPMVGTFYTAASPEDSPFVRVGDKVEENTVVCIIEAMKVMNEVKSGLVGTISEVCVRNGDPVEFGTKIFRVELK